MFSRKSDIDHVAVREQAEAAIEQLDKQAPKVRALASWLERRKNQNGFGQDFEFTLRPKGTL